MLGPVWHGNQDEAQLLVSAITHNCSCEQTASGARSSTCGPHLMMLGDQRALNGLLFVRAIRERFVREEWEGGTPPARFGTVLSNR